MPTGRWVRGILLAFLLVAAVVLVPPRQAMATAGIGRIQGPFSDIPVDTDGNGLANVLRVTVPVSVSGAGEFLVAVQWDTRAEGWNRTTLSAGVTDVRVDMPGWEFAYAGTVSSYNLTILLVNTTLPFGAPLDTAFYNRSAYPLSTFEPTPVRIQGPFSSQAVDTNGDGLTDELVVDFVANVTGIAQLQFNGPLRSGTTQIYWAFGFDGVLEPGLYPMNLTYSGPYIESSGLDGPYTVSLGANVVWNRTQMSATSTSYTTAAYSASSFNAPWARLNPGCVDRGYDANGDGRYEDLNVSLSVTADRNVTVDLQGGLQLPNPIQTSPTFDLTAGSWTLNLSFDGVGIYNNRVNGTYPVVFFLIVVGLGAYGPYSCTTSAYTYTEFEPPTVSFPSAPTFHLQPLDGTGSARELVATVNVSASHAADISVSGQVVWGTYQGSGPSDRLLHVTAGVTAVNLTFSGIDLNRATTDGPWNLSVHGAVVDDLYDVSSAIWTTPTYLRSDFQSAPVANLSGTVRDPVGRPFQWAYVWAVDPGTKFVVMVGTNATGGYALPLYNGTFDVLYDMGSYGTTEVDAVTVHGATNENRTMPAAVPMALNYSLNVSTWSHASAVARVTETSLAPYHRFFADLWGNFDGVAEGNELALYLKHYDSNPFKFYYNPFHVMTDGVTLAQSGDAIVAAAAPVTSKEPLTYNWSANFTRPTPAGIASTHAVRIDLGQNSSWASIVLNLRMPAGFSSTFTTSTGVVVGADGAGGWNVYTGAAPNGDAPGQATVQGTAMDTQPPVASFEPIVVERDAAATLSGAGSTDNEAIANYTWNATVNGTPRFGYGLTWSPIFSEIGTFPVTLSVRDEAGLTSRVTRNVIVRDTTAPSTPTGLAATVTSAQGSSTVLLSWSAVAADDLAGYRVYRSNDSGAPYSLIGSVGASTTSFTDVVGSVGGTFLYRVTSVDRYGNEAAPSSSVQAVVAIAGPGPAPAGLEVLIAIYIVLVAGGIGAAYVVLRSRQGKTPPHERGPVH